MSLPVNPSAQNVELLIKHTKKLNRDIGQITDGFG